MATLISRIVGTCVALLLTAGRSAAFLPTAPAIWLHTSGTSSCVRLAVICATRSLVRHRAHRPASVCRRVLVCKARAKTPCDEALEDWADRMGVERAVQTSYGAFGWGLIAIRDLEIDEAALCAPLSLVLSDQQAPWGEGLGDIGELHSTAQLAAALCHEISLGGASPLKDYFKALPSPLRALHTWDSALQHQLHKSTVEAEAEALLCWRDNVWEQCQVCCSVLQCGAVWCSVVQ